MLSALRIRRHSAGYLQTHICRWFNNATSGVVIKQKELTFMGMELVDTNFLLENIERYEGQEPHFFVKILQSSWSVTQDFFIPLQKNFNPTPPHLDDKSKFVHMEEQKEALNRFWDLGTAGLDIEFGSGGAQVPSHIAALARTSFATAENSLAGAYSSMTHAVVRLLDFYPNISYKSKLINDIAIGSSHGAVCLSENHSNSSVTDIQCRAEFIPEDKVYRLKGIKTCVHGGAHDLGDNIFYIVSARLPNSPDGVNGISLFVVPKKVRLQLTLEQAFEKGKYITNEPEPNDVVVRNLHNVGSSGCTYADIEFGGSGTRGSIAYLLGRENEGITGIQYFLTSNNIQLGFSAVSCAIAAYNHSLEYARNPTEYNLVETLEYDKRGGWYEDVYDTYEIEREEVWLPQSPEDPRLHRKPSIGRPNVKRMLLAQKAYSEGGLALCVYCAYLLDIASNDSQNKFNRDELMAMVNVLSPIVKSWCTEWSMKSCRLSMNIFEGMGVVSNNMVEKFYRECRIHAASGLSNDLHGFDLLTNKISSRSGSAYQSIQACVREDIEKARLQAADVLGGYADSVEKALELHTRTTHTLMEQSKDQPSAVLLAHSDEYMAFTGHVLVGWMWLRQGTIAQAALDSNNDLTDSDKNFYLGKISALDYFSNVELVKTLSQAELLISNPQICNMHQNDWF